VARGSRAPVRVVRPRLERCPRSNSLSTLAPHLAGLRCVQRDVAESPYGELVHTLYVYNAYTKIMVMEAPTLDGGKI
jgi:hypothetical protein